MTVLLAAAGLVAAVGAHAGPAGASSGSPPTAAAAQPTALTVEQALTQARRTGVPVPADAATTPTDTVVANPTGTLTLTRHVVPVRKWVGGLWRDLDATLVRNSDGSVSPAVSSADLRLSGGGSGPLVMMNSGGASLGFSLPVSLPAPTLSGTTATYAGVLPGIDVQVTATSLGGFREVVVVHDAAAAANPLLANLRMTPDATGVSVRADTDGNLTAVDRTGQVRFSAPAPLMWDSTSPAVTPATTHDPDGSLVDAANGHLVWSDHSGPGESAHVHQLGVQLAGGDVVLSPPAGTLSGPGVVYPLYLDPTWTPNSPTRTGYASVNSFYASSNYWYNTPDPNNDYLQVGDYTGTGGWTSHTFLNFALDSSVMSASSINSASLNIFNVYSWSCTASVTYIYAPAATLTSGNATWNAWSGASIGAPIDGPKFAHGYNTSCPGANVGFNVVAGIRAAVSAGRTTQTFLITGVNESTDTKSWKKFKLSSVALSLEINHTPNVPSGMTTSPASSCTAAPPTAVGDGPVSLFAPVSDPDGGTVGAHFELWQTSNPANILSFSDPNVLTMPSGQIANLLVTKAILDGAAGGALTQFSWHIRAEDGITTSAWSTTCNFLFDPTLPAAPTVTGPVGPTIGQAATFTVTPPGSGTTPSSYLYQLNGTAPISVIANSGNASITVVPTRLTNTLTVTSLSAGSNVGATAVLPFNAAANPNPPADADLTGDGNADLLVTGGTGNNVPAGLWLATGQGGSINPNSVDIGAYGNGAFNANPADFTNGQAISGRFTNSGLQDVLVYYPSGPQANSAVIIKGSGDGSALIPASGYQTSLVAGTFTDGNGDNPQLIANAGNSSGQTQTYADLIAVNGDAVNGYYLDYYPNGGGIGGYGAVDTLTGITSPDNTMDWNQWTIATAQTSTGTAMYLWNKTTGALWLWTNLAHTPFGANLTHNSYAIAASGWNTGAAITLQAADINRDGTPDVWAVDSNSVATAYLVTNLTTTPAITAQPAQALTTSNHTWPVNDPPANTLEGSQVTASADVSGQGANQLNLTGSAGASWHYGDVYSPDVSFNGTSGTLTTATPAVDTTGSFSVAVWARPAATGGVILSEDGAHSSRFILWSDTATNSWRFGMATGDTTAWSYDVAAGPDGSARLGVWVHLVAVFDAPTGTMSLYSNEVLIGGAHHAAAVTWPSTGSLVVGRYLTNNAAANFYNGQVSNVQVWNKAIQVGPFYAEYFANQTLSGNPTVTRRESAIDNSWGSGSPDAAIPVDHFSARWTRTQNFVPGTYQFSATSDDGVRLYLDGTTVLDKWIDQSPTTYTVTVAVSAGVHTIKMEYYENMGGATAILRYWPVGSGTFAAQYFANQTLHGDPAMTRNDSSIPFDWTTGSPDPSIPVDHFSARWAASMTFTAGSHTFSVTADDGVRLYVDDVLVIDKWIDQGATTYTAAVSLTAGTHVVRMEYYENTGFATAKLQYT
jgi:hypothetical protein